MDVQSRASKPSEGKDVNKKMQGEESYAEKDEEPPVPLVPLSVLYQYASSNDKMLIVISLIADAIAGGSSPIGLIFFGEIIDAFGSACTRGSQTPIIKEAVYKLLILGSVACIGKWVATVCGGIAKERQMAKYRIEYLHAMIRQDAGWFDCNNPETLASSFGEALTFIEAALGASGVNLIMFNLGQVLVGTVLSFYVQPIVATACLVVCPIIFFALGLANHANVVGQRNISIAYSHAGGVASEALGAIRTVASLGIENQMVQRYTDLLTEAMVAGKKKVFQLNCAVGLILSSAPMMMAIGFIVGAHLIRDARMDSTWEFTCNRDPISGHCMTSPATDYADFNGSESLPTSFCVGENACHAYDSALYIGNQNYSNATSPVPYHLVNGVPVGALTGERCSDRGMQNLVMTCFSSCLLKDDRMNVGLGEERRSLFLRPLNMSAWYDAFLANVKPGGAEDECSINVSTSFISILFIYYAMVAFGVMPQCLATVQKARQACAPVRLLIDRVPPMDPFSDEGIKPPTLQGKIVIKDVVFAYPSAPNFNICRGYSLSIEAGQLCALAGPSGSGKSTIIGLLERFYDAHSGSILIDGHDVTQLNLRWLRSKMALVSQEPVLFSGTVYDAIAYGLHGQCTKAQVEAAARLAHAYTFITTVLADGWDTQVGQGGSKLSGGQKQRVAIARAMIKEPEIILLDEATSALDNQAEKVVQEALDEIRERKKKTTITIAHRLSTIRNADLICVVNKGQVVEKGTWEELLAIPDGIFHHLAAKQEAATAADKEWLTESKAEASRQSLRERQNEDLPEAIQLPGKLGGARGLAGLRQAVKAVQIQVKVAKAFHEESHSKQLELALKAAWDHGNHALHQLGSNASTFGAPPINAITALRFSDHHELAESDSKGGDGKATKNVLKKLKEFERPGDHWILLVGCLASLVSGGIIPVQGLMMVELLLASVLFDPDMVYDESVKYGLVLLLLSIVGKLSAIVEGRCFGIYGEHMTRNLRSHLFRTLLSQEIGFFDLEKNSAGELTQFMAERVSLVQTLIGEKQQLFVRLLGSLGVSIFIVFILGHWLMAIIVWAFVPFLIGCFSVQLAATGHGGADSPSTEEEEEPETNKGSKDKGSKAPKVKSAGQLVGEVVKGIKTVASFTAEEPFLAAYQRDTLAKMKANTSKFMCQGLTIGFVQIALISQSSFQMLIGSLLMDGKYFTEPKVEFYPNSDCSSSMQFLKDILVPTLVIQMIMVPLGTISSQLTDAKMAHTAAIELFERLERHSDSNPSDSKGEKPEAPLNGQISVRDVVFSYPTRKGFPICNGYNIEIQPGWVTALCGASGSGKSTLVNLIQRFYDPMFGTISIDGYDITKLNLAWLRGQLGMVGQEPVLFVGSVFDNISQGKSGGADRSEVEAAAKMAHAHTFIKESLEKGYDTQVGLGGGKLSGGQKQRIAIARALVRKPSIMLLDEATSALDNESEQVVQAALNEMMSQNKKTTITIAHRLSTIRNADLICVIEKGKVVEEGNHESLLALHGIYADLVTSSS